jgi:GT2 family glycosyltransferase
LNSLPKVAIVILNWNGQNYLEKFLPSVLATAYDNMEVIVADNGSSDESVAFLEQHFPHVKVIRFNENNGFAKGYNLALQKIQADYYAIINSDIEVQTRLVDTHY